MKTTAGAKPTPLPGLTGIRGIGALWVLIYHAQFGIGLPVADSGYLGVDLFFILSGFILSHAHPETRWDRARYCAFLRTRIARIFPMHWVALVLLGMVLVLYPEMYLDLARLSRWPDVISSALLMQNWGWGPLAPWNAPAWSLSTEWLVSITFPLFLIPASRIERPICAALLCVLCLGAFAMFLVIADQPNPGVLGRSGIIRTMCDFSAGCLIYRLYAKGVRANTVMALAGAGLVATGLVWPTLAIVTVFGFPIVILCAAQPSNPLTTVLTIPIILFLGEISYSVYLLHWILLVVSDHLKDAWHVHGAIALLWFFCYLAVVIALSSATYHFIEIPARRRLRGRNIGLISAAASWGSAPSTIVKRL